MERAGAGRPGFSKTEALIQSQASLALPPSPLSLSFVARKLSPCNHIPLQVPTGFSSLFSGFLDLFCSSQQWMCLL
jgi:hypothetical protein